MKLNEKYNKLLIAIDVLEKKLKDLYGIEGEFNDLTLAINTHKDVVRFLDEKEKNKSLEVNNNINKLESEYKEKEEELAKDFKFEKDLLVSEYKNTIDRQNDKIEGLSVEIDRLNDMNKQLQNKMGKAYSELKDIATKTVEANGGVKILNNNNPDRNK